MRIRDAVLKTYLGRGTIGRSGERGSGISVLPARYDDDDDDDICRVENTEFPNSLAIHLYHSSLLTGALESIQCSYSLQVSKFINLPDIYNLQGG